MPSTRPGVDRITKRALTATAVWAEHVRDAHLAGCLTCKRAEGEPRKRCGVWWDLARVAHGARRALKAWREPETPGELTLFGEAECDPPPF